MLQDREQAVQIGHRGEVGSSGEHPRELVRGWERGHVGRRLVAERLAPSHYRRE